MSKHHVSIKPQSQKDGVVNLESTMLIDSKKQELWNVMASKKISLEQLSLWFKSKVPYYQEKYGNEKYITIMWQALSNALLTDEERVSESAKLLSRDLTEQQQYAIIDTHNYGWEDAMVFTYSMEVNAVKLKKLIEAWFSLEEATTLTDYGICGKAWKALYQVLNALKTSFSDFYRYNKAGELDNTGQALVAYHIVLSVCVWFLFGQSTQYDWQTILWVVNSLPYWVKFVGKLIDLVWEWSWELPSEEQKTIIKFIGTLSRECPEITQKISLKNLSWSWNVFLEWEEVDWLSVKNENNDTSPTSIPFEYMSQKYQIKEICFTSKNSALLHTIDDKQFSIDLDWFKISQVL